MKEALKAALFGAIVGSITGFFMAVMTLVWLANG